MGDKKAAKYYEDNKEVLRENARNKYRDLPEEEKDITRAYGRDRYRNMTERLDWKNIKDYQVRKKWMLLSLAPCKNGWKNVKFWSWD